MFGTDNPFFPPPSASPDIPSLNSDGFSTELWPSTVKVYETMKEMPLSRQEKIAFGNAQRILNL